MTTIALFHHVLGLTPGVESFAHALREAGHHVTTPDLFDGRTFADLPSGLAYVGQMGDDELLRRAETACADLAEDIVYGGLSLGVVPAQHLLQTRPHARGGIFLHSFVAPDQLAGAWPDGCPVDVFAMDRDPFFVDDGDLAAARAWQAEHGNLRLHLYPGQGHLFMEPASPDYDEAVSKAVLDDVLALLER